MDRHTRPARRGHSGFSLVEVLVAVAAAVVLAAILTPMAFTYIDDSRMARAQVDAAMVGGAMTRFFNDTKKWPGQVEILAGPSIRFLAVGPVTAASLPTLAPPSIGIGAGTCADGLVGVQPGETEFATASPNSVNTINITPLLRIPPPAADYPNWKGPYLSADIETDPWEHVYLINVIPLFCGEVVTQATPGGVLGFAWIISGGPNGTVQTPFTATRVSEGSDDAGLPVGKRVVQGS
jgi:general secretion pathway protein G